MKKGILSSWGQQISAQMALIFPLQSLMTLGKVENKLRNIQKLYRLIKIASCVLPQIHVLVQTSVLF